MRVYDAVIELEAVERVPDGPPREWVSPAHAVKVAFPASDRMVFVSEAPIEVAWKLSPLVPGPRVVHRLRIKVPELPLTVWIDFPHTLQLFPGQGVTAHMPPEVRNRDGAWPNIVLD